MNNPLRWSNRMRFEYKSDDNQNNQGNGIKRPKIEIAIRKSPDPVDALSNPEFRGLGLVDSGADISFIPRRVAEIIGLRLDDAAIKKTTSASEEFSTYRTTMYMEIIHEEKSVEIGEVEVAVPKTDWNVENAEEYILVGRRGLFDKYRITFDNAKEVLCLCRIKR